MQPETRMCATCFEILDLYLGPFGATWQHGPASEHEHPAVPVPVDNRLRGRCDFCYKHSDSFIEFHVSKNLVAEFDEDSDMDPHMFDTEWAACERCAPLIRNGSKHLLINRVILVMPGELSKREKQERRRGIKKLIMAFFDAEPVEQK